MMQQFQNLRPNGVRHWMSFMPRFSRKISGSAIRWLIALPIEEAIHADELGFDFIGTTLVGYTDQSKDDENRSKMILN